VGDLAYTVMLGCVVILFALALRGAQWAVDRATVRRAMVERSAEMIHHRPGR
jgi:hypothetical protein